MRIILFSFILFLSETIQATLIIESGCKATFLPHPAVSAVYSGDLKQIQYQISRGADMNKLYRGHTLPYRSLVFGFPHLSSTYHGKNGLIKTEEIIKFFVDSGADLNIKDAYGSTLLTEIIPHYKKGKHDYLIKMLLQGGADPNLVDGNRQIPLLLSLQSTADPSLFNTLLEFNGDINIKDSQGRGVFHYAMAYASPPIIENLLKKKVPIDEPDNSGRRPIEETTFTNRRFLEAVAKKYGYSKPKISKGRRKIQNK